MITTVTLNVSVDKAYYIKGIVVPGTVARVQKCVNSAGGKGLNVSRIIDFSVDDSSSAKMLMQLLVSDCVFVNLLGIPSFFNMSST